MPRMIPCHPNANHGLKTKAHAEMADEILFNHGNTMFDYRDDLYKAHDIAHLVENGFLRTGDGCQVRHVGKQVIGVIPVKRKAA